MKETNIEPKVEQVDFCAQNRKLEAECYLLRCEWGRLEQLPKIPIIRERNILEKETLPIALQSYKVSKLKIKMRKKYAELNEEENKLKEEKKKIKDIPLSEYHLTEIETCANKEIAFFEKKKLYYEELFNNLKEEIEFHKNEKLLLQKRIDLRSKEINRYNQYMQHDNKTKSKFNM